MRKELRNRFVRRLRRPNHRSVADRGRNVRQSCGKPLLSEGPRIPRPALDVEEGRFAHDRTTFD